MVYLENFKIPDMREEQGEDLDERPKNCLGGGTNYKEGSLYLCGIQWKEYKKHPIQNEQMQSNGQSALYYFTNAIQENALYILDEPENSMSPTMQLELKKFLEDSVRFFGCQFIIATHSPFLLALEGAKIYDIDEETPCEKHWTEVENVKALKDFFTQHENEFRSAVAVTNSR